MSPAAVEGNACALCGASDLRFFARHLDFGLPIRTCNLCGLTQTDFIPAEFLDRFYEQNYSAVQGRAANPPHQEAFIAERGLGQRDYVRLISGRAHFDAVRDMGAGLGGGIAAYSDASTLSAWDPDPLMRARLAQIPTLRLEQQPPADRRFDLVVISHVLEHFNDPCTELVTLRSQLATGGLLFVEVPNDTPEALERKIETLKSGSGHLFFFTQASLLRLLEADGGLDVLDVRAVGAPARSAALIDPRDNHAREDGVWLRALARRNSNTPSHRAPRAATANVEMQRLAALYELSAEHVKLRRSARKLAEHAHHALAGSASADASADLKALITALR